MAFNLKHQTKAQFVARLKNRLTDQNALAFLQNALDAGDLVDADLGMPQNELAALKSKAKKVRDAKKVLEDLK